MLLSPLASRPAAFGLLDITTVIGWCSGLELGAVRPCAGLLAVPGPSVPANAGRAGDGNVCGLVGLCAAPSCCLALGEMTNVSSHVCSLFVTARTQNAQGQGGRPPLAPAYPHQLAQALQSTSPAI